MSSAVCRFCAAPLALTFCDLGMSPLANAFVRPEHVNRGEMFYPLHVFVCERCFLVQLEQFEAPERIFGEYVYFSSYSESWLDHCRAYAEKMRGELRLGPRSLVVEVGSNDGYLLQFFRSAGIPVLGVEPAANVAEAAREKGIPTVSEFFGSSLASRLAERHGGADVVVANNVMAHVPDLNDFVSGLRGILNHQGVLTVEVPHLLRLIEGKQFDTIYHEHFSYFSFTTATRVLGRHGLAVHDVQQLPTHGGSLRIHASPVDAGHIATERVRGLLENEREAGLDRPEIYTSFSAKVHQTKRELLGFLMKAKSEGKRVAGYGAPAKGNTLLNYCGIRSDLLEYTVDLNPHKQSLLLPGTRIPVFHPGRIMETRPDYLLVLPWNIKEEVIRQMAAIRTWGGRFVVPIPEITVI